MMYCAVCILPDTRPNLDIDKSGICSACNNFNLGTKEIDWDEQLLKFEILVSAVKKLNKSYDCLIPVSGGKDSTWQTSVCLEYGLNPLTFTYAPPRRTELGRLNLENLINLGVDHIDVRVNPKIEKVFLLESFKKTGNLGTPMHTAVFNGARSIAHKFDIPLIIWGEDSSVEYGTGKVGSEDNQMNETWLKKYGVSNGVVAAEWSNLLGIKENEFNIYNGISDSELENKKIKSIFLGNYFKWDPVRVFDIAKNKGFESSVSAKLGLYKFADLDDDFISVHHWIKWYKFGFTRLFDNLSLEIRNKRISRLNAIELLKITGNQKPIKEIEIICDFMEIKVEEFNDICEKFRNREIWQNYNGIWKIKRFIIEEWHWE